MKKMTITARGLLLIKVLVTLATVSSCTKNREVKFPYGSGENLLSISDYDGKEFDLTTETEIAQLASSQSDKIKENNSSLKNYNVVKYKTSAQLMDDTAFVGKKNHTYKIKYELTNNYLKVYKIADKEDLSVNEITYAENTSEKKMKVPLLGYPVTGYYKIEKSRNELNEETSSLNEKRTETKAEATHFKINKQGKEVFKSIQKIDTFPANFFDGEWYYAETVTATNYSSQDMYGTSVSVDKFGNSATKVKLVKSESALNFINMNVDDNLKADLPQRVENQVSVISIPASWKDFKQADQGKDKALSEEEIQDSSWSNRRFVKLNLQSSKSILLNQTDSEIQDIQLSDNYFSFTTLDKVTNSKFRHSFYKAAKSSYSPKTYFTNDRNKFGFFYSKQNTLDSAKNYYETDEEKLFHINRFDPTKSIIEFHLSDSSPKWSEKIAEKATILWNEAFKKAGSKIKIQFNTDRVQLGDIRYNVINLISQPDDKFSWGGFGPTITDPQTGEIISSTANVNLNDTTNFIIEILRRMADSKRGLLDKSYILGSPLPSFEEITVPEEGAQNSNAKEGSSNSTKTEIGLKMPIFDKKTDKGFRYAKNEQNKSVKSKFKFGPEKNLSTSLGNIIKDINEQCTEAVTYINNLTAESVTSTSATEFTIYNNCALKVGESRILSVLLHEMGHNFGLRHNFYGSVDTENFQSASARTSSVMEYTTTNEERGGIGPYDVAAIMWAYNDQIETADGSVKIDTSKSIDTNIAEKKISAKKYLYCTDEHVDIYAIDPMCARQDAGVSPLEIVTNKILDYNTSIALGNQKRNRSKISTAEEASAARFQRYVLPIKNFYDFWRFKVAQFAGKGNEYLENYTPEQFEELVTKMKADPNYSKFVESYRPAANLAFNFLTEISFLPDYYCLTEQELPAALRSEKQQKTLRLFSLSNLKNEIFESTGYTANSCKDSKISEYLKNKKAIVVGQGGYYLNDQFKDLNILKSFDSKNVLSQYSVKFTPDVLGNMYDKAYAFNLLSARMHTSTYNEKLGFYPNFYDEPQYRELLQEKLINRMTLGVDINSLRIFNVQESNKVFSPNFADEQQLLQYFFSEFKGGHVIPGKTKENNDRMNLFHINFSYNQDQIEQYRQMGIKVVTTEILGNTYFATEKNKVAFKLLNSAQQINNIKNNKIPDEKVLKTIATALVKVLPNSKNIDTITVSDFTSILGSIRELSATLFPNKTFDNDQAFLGKVTHPHFYASNLINYYKQKMKVKTEEEIEKFSKRNLKEVLKDVEKLIETVNQENKDPEAKIQQINTNDLLVENLGANIQKIIDSGTKIYEIYSQNSDEYEAQQNILTNSLISN